MIRILWVLLNLFDNNWGYSTPLQERFKVGDRVKISIHSRLKRHYRTNATIIETGRHDYLIKRDNGKLHVVYEFELYKS
jgi:hypothetical protein